MNSASTVNASINPDLYKAAVMGNIEPFKETSMQHELTLTPINSTILHLNITSQKKTQTLVSTEFVEGILDICPSLLLQTNAKGETPLHVAAKWGHEAIVRVLIERAKSRHVDLEMGRVAVREMLRMRNNEGNTALHEAVQHCSYLVVSILTKEDPDFSYSANHCGETPLYIAVLRGSLNMVVDILNNCTSPTYEGPNGMTALHAAAIYDRRDITRKILEKKKSLTKETDEYGCTPLHYAAYYGCSIIAKQLLEVDVSAAYIPEKERNMTPLHMAAGQGNTDIMQKIIFQCPDCCDLIDNRGWNFLHFAMVSLSVKALKNVLKIPLLWKLVYTKDVNGNTPLHVLAITHRDSVFDIMNGKQNLSFADLRVLRCGNRLLQQEVEELCKHVGSGPYPHGIICPPTRINDDRLDGAEKARESHLLVATLIATVTFAAAFTLPGGYKSEKDDEFRGTAILSRNIAFQAFVISDAVAMILSLSAVFFHFIMAWKRFRKYLFLFNFAYFFTIVAMVAMVVAFITGTYAVLSPCVGLAIATCLIGVGFLLSVLLIVNWVISIF